MVCRYCKRIISLLIACCCIFSCTSTIHADPITLHIDTDFDVPYTDAYKSATGNKVEIESHSDNIIDAISTAFAIKDDRIDLFVFTAYSGFYLIKDKDFYEPLDNSAVLQEYFKRLYPALQVSLTDDDHLAGWFLDVLPVVQSKGKTPVLQENDLPFPETFSDFLDICKIINEEDLLDDQYRLMDVYKYSQIDMLNLYMKLYVSSCHIAGQIPDFMCPEFLSIVQRIKEEVPAQADIGFDYYDRLPVFEFATAYDTISTDMLPFPRVMDGQDTAIETYATVAIVNPYSKNKEAAIEFLEYCAAHADESAYFYDSTMTEPIANSAAMSAYDRLVKELEGYRQQETLTQEQQDRIAQLEESLIPRYEKQRYRVSPEDIDHYTRLAQNLYVNEGSPLTYDSVLRQYVKRYLSGGLTLEGFAEACQQHFTQIMKEIR